MILGLLVCAKNLQNLLSKYNIAIQIISTDENLLGFDVVSSHLELKPSEKCNTLQH